MTVPINLDSITNLSNLSRIMAERVGHSWLTDQPTSVMGIPVQNKLQSQSAPQLVKRPGCYHVHVIGGHKRTYWTSERAKPQHFCLPYVSVSVSVAGKADMKGGIAQSCMFPQGVDLGGAGSLWKINEK